MSEEAQEVPEDDETVTVDTETGEIIDETPAEPPEETPEDEPAETPEPDEEEPVEEPEAVAVKSDKEMEQVFKSLDKLRKDTAKRVGNIFGDDAVHLMECPLCAAVAPGFLWPQDMAPLHEEQITALRLMLNMPVPTDYRQSESFEACPKCEGLGRVRTGSKVQNYEIAECPRCFAKGYVPTAMGPVPVPSNGAEQSVDQTTGPTVYGHELPQMDSDMLAFVQSLKDRGWMVIEPLQAPRPAV